MKKILFTFKLILFFIGLSPLFKSYSQQSSNIEPEKVIFPSLDGLPITALLYKKNNHAPVIVLCHQARFNKFEYVKIAQTLNEKGFTCLAIDQRSGSAMVEEFNETALKAKELGRPTGFLDAEQDIQAAVNFASTRYDKKIILWGSSYSSTLALYLAIENKNIAAVVAFSPGDYFDKEKGSLKEKLKNLNKPVFITSSKDESTDITNLLEYLPINDTKTQFIPQSIGEHGSKALWKTDENNEEYWIAINHFLEKIKKINYSK